MPIYIKRCDHPDFLVKANVTRLTDYDGGPVTGFTTDIKVRCAKCSMSFLWLGLPKGAASDKPMTSFDCLELRAPITPVEET